MGGCITPPVPKKAKAPGQPQQRQSHSINPNPNSTQNTPLLQPTSMPIIEPPKPKYKRIVGDQFVKLYRIEENVGSATRVQGPKYISSFSDGTGRVLRIIPAQIRGIGGRDSDIETRVQIYAQILGLEIYEDDQSNLLILQEYFSGPYLHELKSESSTQSNPQQIRSFLIQVYTLIQLFHSKSIVLGNITMTSFCQVSEYSDKISMIQLNLLGNFNIQQSMGHAFKLKPEKSMDWEAFGFIVQSSIGAGLRCPVFVQHKLEYVQGGGGGVVGALLKGKKIKREQLDGVKYVQPNKSVILGYQFRADLNKLLKLRKRRTPHRQIYYPEDTLQSIHPSLPNHSTHPSDQVLQRLQTSRVLSRIEKYIQSINSQCQQAFMMYSTYNQSLKKLKGVFVMSQNGKKMEQFKETLSLIK